RFNGDRNATYYVVVGGQAAPGNNFKTDDHGRYLVNVTIPIPDDHPNDGEFSFLGANDTISIAATNGQGAANGILETDPDTDLFQFTALGTGDARITIDTPGSGLSPELRLFDPTTSEIDSGVV